jgi:hypothetical protein
VVTSQPTASRAVAAKSGMIPPATITPQTDFNLMDTTCVIDHRFNEARAAVIVLYADAKGEIAVRVLRPEAVTLTKDNAITCHAYRTLRREWRSFRLDRIISCHELTTPADAEPEEPHQHFEDTPAGRNLW